MLSVEEQAAFFESVARVRHTVVQHLHSARQQESVITFVQNLQKSASDVVQTALEPGVGIACQAACSHCCHARVEAMAPEILYIARKLAGRSTRELQGVIQRLRTHVMRPAHSAQWRQSQECPFLENKLCTIYDIRPCACRKAHSLDVLPCQSSAPEIPQNLAVIVAVEALVKGTAEAYSELGLHVSGHEFVAALLLALEDPSVETRWFNGEPVFSVDAP